MLLDLDGAGEAVPHTGDGTGGVQFTVDSHFLVCVRTGEALAVVDLHTRRVIRTVPVGGVSGLAVTPDGRRAFVTATQGGASEVRVYSLESGLELLTLPAVPALHVRLQLSPDGTRLAATFLSGETWVYDGRPTDR
jgi:hypothetical protein